MFFPRYSARLLVFFFPVLLTGCSTAFIRLGSTAATEHTPTLSSLAPASAATGSSNVQMTVTGMNFISSSTVNWNGSALSTTYVNATTLLATIPQPYLTSAGHNAVTVTNPLPVVDTSSAASFTVDATGSGSQITLNIAANDIAWDSFNQVLYLSLPTATGTNGGAIQLLNPVTGKLGTSVSTSSEPNLLAVSSTSKYLYVGLDAENKVQRLTLPDLGTDVQMPLGSDSRFGAFHAMDLQAAPNADDTVAVVRGADDVIPEEEGGVVIYDDATARANVLCGWIQVTCPSAPNLYDSIQWNADGTEMFAANYEASAFDFYTIPVTASGFGTQADYRGLVNGFGYSIHFDKTTGYVYDDDGYILNPATGTKIGTFAASGIMVPDGANGKAFFLGQTSTEAGSTTYTLESFNIQSAAALASITISNVVGTPTHFIRWGTNGLAFTTFDKSSKKGAVYIVSGSFIAGVSSGNAAPQNVVRSWTTRFDKPSSTTLVLR